MVRWKLNKTWGFTDAMIYNTDVMIYITGIPDNWKYSRFENLEGNEDD